jgi:hypothetical protein
MYFETDYARRIDFDRLRSERVEKVRAGIETEG